MHRSQGIFSSSPTDLANFLACRHKTALDLLVAFGELTKPVFEDPLVDVLRERGLRHEKAFVDRLRAIKATVLDLSDAPPDAETRLIDAMAAGVDVIVQAPLRSPGWFGYADVLRRVDSPSPRFGAWSYEALDTKLARETKGGTILQLCVYSDILSTLQGTVPERFFVVTPEREEPYRVADFAALYRWIKSQYSAFILSAPRTSHDAPRTGLTYPAPADHCDICRWWERCNAQRRRDDHLTFVAGLGRSHLAEWHARDVITLASLAGVPIPLEFRPRRGARETLERQREQARVQLEQRQSLLPVYELLPPEEPAPGDPPTNIGLAALPPPSPHDLFVDLEGDPFAREGGREYLFGLWRPTPDGRSYEHVVCWADNDGTERSGFEWLVDQCVAAIAEDPDAHVYHFAPYEPAALKRLMGRHASREAEIDELLRAERFVDLHGVVRRAIRAGVESYSIKKLERYYGFTREIDLGHAADRRRLVEVALELDRNLSDVSREVRDAVECYNRDDCRSTQALRDWLESVRRDAEAGGLVIPRPVVKAGEAPERVGERQQRVAALRPQLLDGVPSNVADRTPDQHARYVVAYAMDWHRRESKAAWWDYYRLIELADDELLDERGAVAGLEFTGRRREVLNKKTGRPTGSVIDEYAYPEQEMEIRAGANLKTKSGKGFGTAESVDRDRRVIAIKKGKAIAEQHPSSVFEHRFVSPDVLEDSIFRSAHAIAAAGSLNGASPLIRRLLTRTRPDALQRAVASSPSVGEAAVVCVQALAGDVLAIQGPPGAGKTHTGAEMICALVADGKRVGVTATSHKVLRNLLDAVARAAERGKADIKLAHKVGSDEAAMSAETGPVREVTSDDEMLLLMQTGTHVAGGTAWLFANEGWTQPGDTLDVLFVDEASQMSLANVLAVAPSAHNLVLLGDPQQLDQPLKGSHPEGLEVSALEYILGDAETMPVDRGLFLPVTHRLAPAIADFTSEVFYGGKLRARPGLEHQRLAGTRFTGAGLWTIDVEHEGCSNASDEEVAAVARLVAELTASDSTWSRQRTDTDGEIEQLPMTLRDVLVVAPYNAQVARLKDALPAGARVGTVDKFQGQEAPVVIYSMTSSSVEDAPRGMEFLYSANRLNVATSRARCACLLLASPRLFDPECRTTGQMRLANALCRFRELSTRAPLRGQPLPSLGPDRRELPGT